MSSQPPPIPPQPPQGGPYPPPYQPQGPYPQQQGYPPPQGYPPQQYPAQPLNYATPMGALPCPRCGQYAAKPVKFTWWGGLLGPKLLSHHKCQACGHTFNGKTGQPNTTAIAIYLAISAVFAIVVFILLMVG